jgi:hypothetical protein
VPVTVPVPETVPVSAPGWVPGVFAGRLRLKAQTLVEANRKDVTATTVVNLAIPFIVLAPFVGISIVAARSTDHRKLAGFALLKSARRRIGKTASHQHRHCIRWG